MEQLYGGNLIAPQSLYGGSLVGTSQLSGGFVTQAPLDANLQEKTVDATPSAQTITPDEDYDGMTSVTVNAMPSAQMSGATLVTNPSLTYDSATRIVTGSLDETFVTHPISTPGYATTDQTFQVRPQGTGTIAIPTDPWNYIGDSAELVEEIYPKTSVLLKNTSFNGWTPSTTTKTIVSSSTLSSKAFTADLSEYEYLLRWRWSVDVAYASGATLKTQIYRPVGEVWQIICKRPSSLANIGSETFNGNACITYYTAALLSYYNSSGGLTYTWSATYGLYASVTACTFASSTADSTTVTPKTPTWNARCSTTYMSTTRAAELDQNNTSLIMRGELWRIKKKGTVREMLENCCDIYNDHLNP